MMKLYFYGVIIGLIVLVVFFGVQSGLKPKGLAAEQPVIEPEETGKKEEKIVIEKTAIETKENMTAMIYVKFAYFEPVETKVKLGTNVFWVNNDTRPHKIIADDRAFIGPKLMPGEQFNYTFNKLGRFRFIDAVFKNAKGWVVVE